MLELFCEGFMNPQVVGEWWREWWCRWLRNLAGKWGGMNSTFKRGCRGDKFRDLSGLVPEVKEKQEKDKIGTKPDKNEKRGKPRQCRRPITVEKEEKRRKYKFKGPNMWLRNLAGKWGGMNSTFKRGCRGDKFRDLSGKDYAKPIKNQSKSGNIGHEIESLHQKPDQRAFFYKDQANKAKCQKIESSKAILAILQSQNQRKK
nr:hypothetical protein [Tanacetum cinerariifolium]